MGIFELKKFESHKSAQGIAFLSRHCFFVIKDTDLLGVLKNATGFKKL